MANVLVDESALSSIANAIREKNGTEDTYKPSEMADAISAISGNSNNDGEVAPEIITISGNSRYAFANKHHDWILENYSDRIQTSNLTDCQYMFANSEASKIPFEINAGNSWVSGGGLSHMFDSCSNLKHFPPAINHLVTTTNMDYIFYACTSLETSDQLPQFNYANDSGRGDGSAQYMFAYCYNLKELKFDWMKQNIPNNMYIYCYLISNCYSIKEIKIPVIQKTATANRFVNTFVSCYMLSDVVFETQEDGSPYEVNWHTQTISLTGIGYGNSVISAPNTFLPEFEMTTSTYETLKDNPNRWSKKQEYSRYNHDSAVRTINSLPDTSAYLATVSNKVNTIKFSGANGSATDGGAISTLTDEEIAVATAKGWTVSII